MNEQITITKEYWVKLVKLIKETRQACSTTNTRLQEEKWNYLEGYINAGEAQQKEDD